MEQNTQDCAEHKRGLGKSHNQKPDDQDHKSNIASYDATHHDGLQDFQMG
jgi:hypothetical protein